MKSLARLSVIGIVGLGLGTAATVLAESGAAATAATPSDAGPAERTKVSVSHGSKDGPGQLSTSSSARSESKSGGMTSNGDERKFDGGGYSWSDKKRLQKHQRLTTERLDPKRPLTQAPSFELRPDGTSVVTLSLSQSTEVKRKIVGRRVEYELKDAQIGVSNNTNPLVTAHFATPLLRVALRRSKHFATLRLELRENVQPTHQLRGGIGGGTTLEIILPKPSRIYAARVSKPPAKHDVTDDTTERTTTPARRKAKLSAPTPGPGPRL